MVFVFQNVSGMIKFRRWPQTAGLPDTVVVLCVVIKTERTVTNMAQKKLLTNGTTSKCNDGRWHGTVWYLDEAGERKRCA